MQLTIGSHGVEVAGETSTHKWSIQLHWFFFILIALAFL